eukprot:TRINITY_DN16019_c0_g1_i1.p2 TRINITY_DN16019_c0_g1~~TRINITY_DN16019_c0_g1_i1.p2  ORF type:complete len:348 (-),score=115.68 TRINITY_DN16019_c0_g1_i1:2264-3307(-)
MTTALLLTAAAAAIVVVGLSVADTTSRPVVGILSLPLGSNSSSSSPDLTNALPAAGSSNDLLFSAYIPASYVKFVESGGARVVPIHHKLPVDQLETLVSKLNGVLLTGGQDITDLDDPYYRSAEKIIQIASQRNQDRSQSLVLWGTCLGMETIVRIVSQNYSILTHFQSIDVNLPNQFTSNLTDSTIFSSSEIDSKKVVQLLSSQEEPVSFNAHSWGLAPEDFQSSQLLVENFRVTATAFDENGKEFVSIIEGNNSPMFAVQFHPEKSLFEWDAHEVIDHSNDAVTAMQYLASFLGGQARLSGSRKFQSELELQPYLIYNYVPIFTANFVSFDQIYFFPDPAAAALE